MPIMTTKKHFSKEIPPQQMDQLEFIDWVTTRVEELKQREINLKKVIFDVKEENKQLKKENMTLKANYAKLVRQYKNITL